MIKLEIIKHQMEKMNMNSSYLWKLTGIGYATINGILNGDRQLETIQVKNYERIINVLFTPLERCLAERSDWGVNQYEAFYKEALKSALKSEDLKIYRSGAVGYNENNEPGSIPVHIKLQWGFLNDKAINKSCREVVVGRHLHDLRIFDNEMYNEMNRKSGQLNKRKLVEEFVKNKL
jgi:hypothetical protein